MKFTVDPTYLDEKAATAWWKAKTPAMRRAHQTVYELGTSTGQQGTRTMLETIIQDGPRNLPPDAGDCGTPKVTREPWRSPWTQARRCAERRIV